MDLHSIDKKLAVLEERTKALPEIKNDLKALRDKLEKQAVKQAATAATVAIVVSIVFSFLTNGKASHATTPSHLSVPEHSDKQIVSPKSGISTGRNH